MQVFELIAQIVSAGVRVDYLVWKPFGRAIAWARTTKPIPGNPLTVDTLLLTSDKRIAVAALTARLEGPVEEASPELVCETSVVGAGMKEADLFDYHIEEGIVAFNGIVVRRRVEDGNWVGVVDLFGVPLRRTDEEGGRKPDQRPKIT